MGHRTTKYIFGQDIQDVGPQILPVLTGIMESEFFVSEILKKHLEPFLALVYPDGHRFMQNNDLKHTSKRAKESTGGKQLQKVLTSTFELRYKTNY